MGLKEVPWDEPMADDALEALSDVQKKLSYVTANTIGYALGKLSIWEQAKQDGRLVELPERFKNLCEKYGDYIYRIVDDEVNEYLLCTVEFSYAGKLCLALHGEDEEHFEVPLSTFGKTVFLTRQEAEKALESEGT